MRFGRYNGFSTKAPWFYYRKSEFFETSLVKLHHGLKVQKSSSRLLNHGDKVTQLR